MLAATIVLASTLTIPPALAYPCLDENEWFCNPDPQILLPPEVGDCEIDCQLETYWRPGPGDDVKTPEVWLVGCQAEILLLTTPVALVSDNGQCPAGWEPSNSVPTMRLLPATNVADIEAAVLITLVTGECPVTREATVYGSGVEHHTDYVPCAHPA